MSVSDRKYCHLSWEAKAGAGPSLLLYGPTWLENAPNRPRASKPVPGLTNRHMVFDPKTPNRRVFIEHNKKVYMIVSGDTVPLATLAKALLGK